MLLQFRCETCDAEFKIEAYADDHVPQDDPDCPRCGRVLSLTAATVFDVLTPHRREDTIAAINLGNSCYA